ncbi:MAG: hypothetical protein ACP5VE_05375 [Chthonomonadales bacterium]
MPTAGGRVAWLPYVLFGLFSIALSVGFYLDGMHAQWSALSGDQINILTICAAQDHPGMMEGDEIAGRPGILNYYIPFFVRLVRLASLPDHNYLRGLNLLLFATSIAYLWGWWLLFRQWAPPVVAGLCAFLVRGIVWLPGNEVWGIAGIWSMLPRTLFLAMVPWVLLFWLWGRTSDGRWYACALVAGCLVNVHPISGLAFVGGLLAAEAAYSAGEGRSLSAVARRMAGGAAASAAGMAPYVWVYFNSRGSLHGVSSAELDAALAMRITSRLRSAREYLKDWVRPKVLFLVVAPWIAVWFALGDDRTSRRPFLLALASLAAGCLLVAFGSVGLERLLAAVSIRTHMAYELIRGAKYVLLPSYLVAVVALGRWTAAIGRTRRGREALVGIVWVVLMLTLFSRQPVFNRVPILQDDAVRMLWPDCVPPPFLYGWEKKTMDPALAWIRRNTPPGSRFVGPSAIRPACLRPVIHDWAASTMLVQGDPVGFVQAARREQARRRAIRLGPGAQARLYQSWGGQYWMTRRQWPGHKPLYADTVWRIYDLSGEAS